MKNRAIIIHTAFAFVFLCTQPMNLAIADSEIPAWVKNTAKFWGDGQVSDSDFIKGIQYLMQQGIITVPPSPPNLHPSNTIPAWVKNTAKWWGAGQVSDAGFIQSIQYMVQNGIISVQAQIPSTGGPTTIPADPEYQTYNNTKYGFSVEYPKGWNIVERFGAGYTIQSIMISQGTNLQINIGVLKNNNPYAGLTNAEILGDVTSMLRQGCSNTTFQARGFSCTSPQFFSNVTSDHGMQLYGVGMIWTKSFSNGTSIKWTSIWGIIPSGNDVWIMASEASADEFVKYQQEISHIGNSLNLFPAASTPSDQSQSSGVGTTTSGGNQPYGGYSSKESYCQAKYGSNVHYDPSLNKCVSYGGYNTPEEYCQGKYGSAYHYDASTNKCVSYSGYSGTSGGGTSGGSALGIDLTGQWDGTVGGSGSYSYIDQSTGNQERVNCQFSGHITFYLTQTGTRLGGSVSSTLAVTGDPDCQQVNGYPFQGALSASIFGSGFSGSVGTLSINGQFTQDLLRGSFSGDIGVIPVQGQFTASRSG